MANITSIIRQTPTSTPTNLDTVTFRVTFSEDVQGVNGEDFQLSGTAAIDGLITSVNPVSGSVYDVTVGGVANSNGSINLDISPTQNITAISDGSLLNPSLAPLVEETFTLDNTAPLLNSIARSLPTAALTNADTLTFRATFNGNVINVTGDDFVITGPAGVTVTATQVVGDPSAYNIQVLGGNLATYNGTVNIALAGGANITDAAGNAVDAAAATFESYQLDNIGPVLQSFTRLTPLDGTTNANTVTFLATFSEAVQGVGTNDFVINALPAVGATITSVTPSAANPTTQFEITIGSGINFYNGAIGIDLAPIPTIRDLANNALPVGEPVTDETYTLDNTVPTVLNVTAVGGAAADGSYRAGQTIEIAVQFSEDVNVTGTPTLNLETGVTDGVATYVRQDAPDTLIFSYTVAAGHNTGDLNYRNQSALVLPTGATIVDAAGNNANIGLPALAGANSLAGNQAIVIDTVLPTVTSITRLTPATSLTAADTLTFRVTFSEAVIEGTVNAGDFVATGTTGIVSGVTRFSDTQYDITVSDGDLATFNGVVGLNLAAPTITDAAGNNIVNAEPGIDQTYQLDNTTPTITSISSTTPDGEYNAGETLLIQVTFSESVLVTGTPTLTLNNNGTATYVSGSDTNTLTFSYLVGGGDLDTADLDVTAINLPGGAAIADGADNNAVTDLPGDTNLADNKELVIDNTVPTLLSIVRQVPNLDPVANPTGLTNADSLTFRLTFDEEMEGLDAADFVVVGATTANVTSVTATDATNRIFDVTVSGGDLANLAGDEVIGVDFAAAPTVTDVAGNDVDTTLPGTNETYTVENTAPTITGVTSTTAPGTYGVGTVIGIEVTFSEDVFVDTTGGTPTLALNSSGTAVATYVGVGATPNVHIFNYTVVDGEDSDDLDYDSTTSLQLNGGTIRDLATNNANLDLAGPGTAGSLGDAEDIVIDTTEPTVLSIVRQVPTDAVTSADVLTFRVTFSEAVDPATVQATDFIVNGVVANVASADAVGGDNSVFDVVISDAAIANFNGTVGLDVEGEIRDAGNNILNTAEPTTDETYTLDNDVPTILNITSSTADDVYNGGDTISIQVEFSEAVTVVGTPTLTLNNGATATFDSVNGSTVTFVYDVQAGDTDTADLDVTAVNIPADTIEDTAGNDAQNGLPGTNLADNKDLVIDNTEPTLLSIVRQVPDLDPVANPTGLTNADSLTFRLTFSEAMEGLDVNDFVATGTTATVSAVTSVGTTGTVFDVTISGGDLADLPGPTAVGLDFAATPTLTDVVGNEIDAATAPGTEETFTVENTAPTITGVVSTAVSDTYGVAAAIDIEVTFNEVVFVNTTSGTPTLALNSGAATVAEYIDGNGTTTLTFRYTVAAGENSTDLDYDSIGALQLNGGTIQDLAANNAVLALPTPGTVGSISDDLDIVIDTTIPTITSITRQDPTVAVTNADALTFRVTFSEAVDPTTVTVEDFTVNGVVVDVASVTAVGIDNAVFDVVVNDAAIANFNGTVGLDVDGEILDAGGNILNTTEPTIDQTYTLDNTAPAVINITSSTLDGRYNAGNNIAIQVEFNGPVNVDALNPPSLDLSNGATATFVGVTGNVVNFRYTIADGDAESADLDVTAINAGAGSITDAAGNEANITIPAGENLADEKELVVDTVAPTLVSITRLTPAIDPVANPTGLTNADSVVFQVTFSEAVRTAGVTAVDFVRTGTTATITSVVREGGTSETVFNVTLLGGNLATLNGPVGLDLSPTAIIQDIAGNSLDLASVADPDEIYTLDNTQPTVANVDFDAVATPDGTYSVGDQITILITFSEAVTVTGAPELTLDSGGTAIYDSISVDGTVLTFLYTVGNGDTSDDLDYTSTNALTLAGGAIADIATNVATLTLPAPGEEFSLSDDRDVIIDTAQPTIVSIERQTPDVAVTNEDVLVFRVTFNEDVTGTVDAADFVVNGTTTATVTNVTAVSATEYDVEVSGGDLANFNGTVGLNLSGTADIDDIGGNNVVIEEPTTDEIYTLDNIPPQIASITSETPDGSYNAGDVISIQVTFDGAVVVDTTGGDPTLTLNSGGTATYDSISTDGTVLTFLYTVGAGDNTDDLSVDTITLNGGVIADAATNDADLALPGGGNLDVTSDLVIDTIAPTLTSILRQTPDLNPLDNPDGRTNADSLTFRLTFSEEMTGVDIADFDVTGTTTATVTGVVAVGLGGQIFDVTLSGGDLADLPGDAAIGVEFATGASLTDVAGNQVEATLPAPPDDNQTFVVENTPPTVTDVTSAIADGTYGVGEVIDITITFSEIVFVAGAPALTLNSGGVADYLEGDGTTTLTFRYTVADGDNSTDLDYESISALTLNGGSIRDLATNNANLTLAALDPTGTLGDNKAIVIDTANPSVVSILRQTPTAAVTNAASLTFRVTFSEDVTGTVDAADFEVNSTSTATVTGVTPVSGTEYDVTVSGGNLASFNGTVGLNLAAGADIDDAGGNNVVIEEPTPAENDQTYTVDTTAPTVTNVTSTVEDGIYNLGDVIPITITFSEIVTVTGTPTLTLETGDTDEAVSYVEGSGTNTLTFNFTVQAGDATDDLEYLGINALVLGGGTILDAAGNAATLTLPNTGNVGSLGFNKDIALDTIIPELTSITRQNPIDELTTATSVTFRLTFTEAVENINPADFTITGGSTATVSAITDAGGGVVFDVTVSGGDIGDDTFSGTLGLALAATSDISDAAGNLVVLAAGATTETYTFDNTAPTITNVTAQEADGIYETGDEIRIEVTFDDVVTVAGNPTLQLETGDDDATATYVSGDGTNTLVFLYTVRAGDETIDLDYRGISALALGVGGSIQDEFGNNADLTLPEPGAAGSLGANKAIRIDTVPPELLSIARETPEGQRTNSDSLVFLVSFSEDVENLDAADFTITGGSTATVTGVTPTGENPGEYTVTVSGGDLADFNGTVGLVINDGAQDITDPAGRDLAVPTAPNPAESYLLDNEAPLVTGIVRRTPASQNTVATTLVFTVIFSEQVENIDVSDFTLDTTGSLTATVGSVSVTAGDRVDVTLTNVNGEGTVSLDVLLASATLADVSGNGLAAGFTDGEFYLRDASDPTVEITQVRPLLQDGVVTPAPDEIRIRFSEPVTGFDISDLQLQRDGSNVDLSGATLTANATNTNFTLGNLATLTAPDGEYNLTLNAGAAGIIDIAGNALLEGDVIDWVRASTTPVPPEVPIFDPNNPPSRIEGTVRVDTIRGTDGPNFIPARARNDVARGLGGNDRIAGQTGDDSLFGGSGSDRLIGGPGNDILTGQGSADFIEGNRGRDVLRGGSGDDTLVGGIGNDTLVGGGGADVYRFNVPRDARDTIERFDPNADVIDLTNLFRPVKYQGDSPIQRFLDYVVIGTTADGAGTSVRIDTDGNGSSEVTYTLVELVGVAPSLISGRNFVIG